MLTIWEKLHGVTFKKRAPRAIKEIKAFAEKAMVRQQFPSTRSCRFLLATSKAIHVRVIPEPETDIQTRRVPRTSV